MQEHKEHGKVIIPYGALPKEHELEIAQILIRTGKNVKFLPISSVKTPDLQYNNLDWELKSPIGKSSRAIENCLRYALKQSPNIIIDLRRICLNEGKCLSYLQNHIKNFHGLKKLLIITKSKKVLKIMPKNACFSEITMLK